MTNKTAASEAALGAVFGALAGDAAGATLEFIGRAPTRNEVQEAMRMVGGGVWRTAPGQVTDDGELSVALARSLVGAETYDQERAAHSYHRWLRSRPFDIGTATRGALNVNPDDSGLLANLMMLSAARHNSGSKANGSLMRLSPLGVWSQRLTIESAVTATRNDAQLTHPHISCQFAAAAYVVAIRHLMLHQGDFRGSFLAAKSVVDPEDGSEVLSWLDAAERGDGPAYHPVAGFVKIAFTHAFRHLLLGSSYEQAIQETLTGGGDTDTNACIVGGLIGALHGISGIPQVMWKAVSNCQTELGRPRPAWLSTRDLSAVICSLV